MLLVLRYTNSRTSLQDTYMIDLSNMLCTNIILICATNFTSTKSGPPTSVQPMHLGTKIRPIWRYLRTSPPGSRLHQNCGCLVIFGPLKKCHVQSCWWSPVEGVNPGSPSGKPQEVPCISKTAMERWWGQIVVMKPQQDQTRTRKCQHRSSYII